MAYRLSSWSATTALSILIVAPVSVFSQDLGDAVNEPEITVAGSTVESEDADIVVEGERSEKVICKNQSVTGSRFKTRVCRTETELAELKEQTIQTTDNRRRSLADVVLDHETQPGPAAVPY